ncbi:MAG: hypothetical protein KatS3mg005_4165 [Bryobacteraceae bacterium]|nr:MAG: hypothetical protein KatS3mg005_4165 [Bryobacteraceae bacterium]
MQKPLRLRLRHPQFRGPVNATIYSTPDDDEAATAQTIALMAHYVRQDSRSPIVRRAAAEAAEQAKGKDVPALAAAVWRWIRARVRFVADSVPASALTNKPELAELLIRPVDLLTMPDPAGDCDDQSMLCAAMLRALGVETAFRTVAADPAQPQFYSHVYVIAYGPAGEIALDCSHGREPGWEVKPAGKVRTWRIEAVKTLGAIDWGELIKIGAQTGSEIAKARFGQPPAGTYIQDRDRVIYRQPEGASPLTFPGVGLQVGAGSGGSLLLIIGAVVLLLAVSRR